MHLGRQGDDIALIRSMHTSHSNHYNSPLGMHTGSFAFARPSIGAWSSYSLGTVNRNLPSFLVLDTEGIGKYWVSAATIRGLHSASIQTHAAVTRRTSTCLCCMTPTGHECPYETKGI